MQPKDPSQSDDYEEMEVYPENANKGQFRNLALFYLKLQAKLLLSSSTIQTVIEHYQEIRESVTPTFQTSRKVEFAWIS